VRKY